MRRASQSDGGNVALVTVTSRDDRQQEIAGIFSAEKQFFQRTVALILASSLLR